MKLKTEQFGEIEYAKENVIRMEKGLFGFEHLEEYLLVQTENTLFYWLNSIKEPLIAFPMVGINVLDDTYPQVEGSEPFGIVTLDKDYLEHIQLKNNVDMKYVQLTPVNIDNNNASGGNLLELEVNGMIAVLEQEKPNLIIVDALTSNPLSFAERLRKELSFKCKSKLIPVHFLFLFLITFIKISHFLRRKSSVIYFNLI